MQTESTGPVVGRAGGGARAPGADIVRAAPQINIGQLERTASAVIGGALLLRGSVRHPLASLALALTGGELIRRGVTGRSLLYGALDVSTAEPNARREAGAPARAPEVERSITIGRSAEELHRVWRDPQSLSRIMGPLVEVDATGDDGERWTVRGPRGRRFQWESRIVEDRPGELVRWESLPGAEVPNAGEVRFQPASGDRGTEVRLRMRFVPPGGPLGEAAAKTLKIVPRMVAEKALRRFKSLVETGEIPTTEGQPAARDGGRGD